MEAQTNGSLAEAAVIRFYLFVAAGVVIFGLLTKLLIVVYALDAPRAVETTPPSEDSGHEQCH
jgi:hypothetical protein